MIKKQLNRDEKGVVLITCLIFLILLLTLIRFTIGSAKMSELKVGADFDEISAKAALDITFQDAELMLKRVTVNGISLQDPTLNLVNNAGQVTKQAIDFWADPNNLVATLGLYDGDSDPCTDQLCSNHVPDWNATCNDVNAGFTCYGRATGANAMPANQGKYIIERFSNIGLNIDLDDAQEEIMVFRVTGIGYSQSGIAGNNATDAIRQDTYVLTYSPDIN